MLKATDWNYFYVAVFDMILRQYVQVLIYNTDIHNYKIYYAAPVTTAVGTLVLLPVPLLIVLVVVLCRSTKSCC
jgi:hypothetical protein